MYIIEYLDTSRLPNPQQWHATLKTDTSLATCQRLPGLWRSALRSQSSSTLGGQRAGGANLKTGWFLVRIEGMGKGV